MTFDEIRENYPILANAQWREFKMSAKEGPIAEWTFNVNDCASVNVIRRVIWPSGEEQWDGPFANFSYGADLLQVEEALNVMQTINHLMPWEG